MTNNQKKEIKQSPKFIKKKKKSFLVKKKKKNKQTKHCYAHDLGNQKKKDREIGNVQESKEKKKDKRKKKERKLAYYAKPICKCT